MLDSIIKKVIARNGEREVIDSTYEEMQKYVLTNRHPDFIDDTIIAIKFLIAADESMEDADETSWFVNPVYTRKLPEITFMEMDEVFNLSSPSSFGFSYHWTATPKLAPEFLPELVPLATLYPNVDIFQKYCEFRNVLLLKEEFDLTDEEKFSMFIDWAKENNKFD